MLLLHEAFYEDDMFLATPVDRTRGRKSLPTTNWGHAPFTTEELDREVPISEEQLSALRGEEREVPPEIDHIIQQRIAAVRRLGDRRAHDTQIDLS